MSEDQGRGIRKYRTVASNKVKPIPVALTIRVCRTKPSGRMRTCRGILRIISQRSGRRSKRIIRYAAANTINTDSHGIKSCTFISQDLVFAANKIIRSDCFCVFLTFYFLCSMFTPLLRDERGNNLHKSRFFSKKINRQVLKL